MLALGRCCLQGGSWKEGSKDGTFLESAGKDPELILVRKANADVWCLP